jgi:hypothetical protein
LRWPETCVWRNILLEIDQTNQSRRIEQLFVNGELLPDIRKKREGNQQKGKGK